MVEAKVVFIGGVARSGSTLVALALGTLPGCVSVGELHWIWERGVVNDELCGCGMRFSECEFWSTVGGRAFGGWEQVDARALAAVRGELYALRHLPRLFTGGRLPGADERRIASYAAHMERLYGAIRSVSGCDIIVDASKRPAGALLLRRMRLRPYFLHLTRDPRGVVFSWSKRVVRPEITDRIAYMGRRSTLRASVRWVVLNLIAHGLPHAGIPRLLVRYESFVADPGREIERIARFIGLSGRADLSLVDGKLPVTAGHTVAGNPLRFRYGLMPIRLDDEWKHKMHPRDQMLVSAVTSPLRAIYGYRTGDGATVAPGAWLSQRQ